MHAFANKQGKHYLSSETELEHSGPKMLKSKQRGAGPKFMYRVNGGHIGITKNRKFFKSVGRNF